VNAQQSFHLVSLGLCLCLLAGVFSRVWEKSELAVQVQKSDISVTSPAFWKELAHNLIQRER
jgi:hypothetical protein